MSKGEFELAMLVIGFTLVSSSEAKTGNRVVGMEYAHPQLLGEFHIFLDNGIPQLVIQSKLVNSKRKNFKLNTLVPEYDRILNYLRGELDGVS